MQIYGQKYTVNPKEKYRCSWGEYAGSGFGLRISRKFKKEVLAESGDKDLSLIYIAKIINTGKFEEGLSKVKINVTQPDDTGVQ